MVVEISKTSGILGIRRRDNGDPGHHHVLTYDFRHQKFHGCYYIYVAAMYASISLLAYPKLTSHNLNRYV